jgi:hypothetical protein
VIVWIALDQGLKQPTDLARILPDLQALLSFTRDLEQRLDSAGVDGISGALGLHRLLVETLDAIPRADIERALAEVEILVGTLRRYAETLAELRALRERLGPI